jgi:hypothetical protein
MLMVPGVMDSIISSQIFKGVHVGQNIFVVTIHTIIVIMVLNILTDMIVLIDNLLNAL